ncbi:MAG: hypothetical protein S4CHLAM81_00800 [Chlamydiales bacterium]|nr:hypothetical protein [Chlamydiales bacterium]MCH9634876.1 hypothetical protein [Chlamydiales bacterium]MCH9703861.1 cupin domain-containing protein [Chlamydiota bacterium]
MKKINLDEKFKLFNAPWTPKILAEANGSYIKIFKAKGEFVWHSHDNEDELFLVIKGTLHIKLENDEITLNAGEFFVVPKKVKHLPYTTDEAHVLLLEPKTVLNTGDASSDKTVENPDWI